MSHTEPVSSRNALFTFYDIESLKNAFSLCYYNPKQAAIGVFFLVDPGTPFGDALREEGLTEGLSAAIRKDVLAKNPAIGQRHPGGVRIDVFDLATFEGNKYLAWLLGLSDAEDVNDPSSPSSYSRFFRPVCDTDTGVYDPIGKHPYLAGYNSGNYDTSMAAMYLQEAFSNCTPELKKLDRPGISTEEAREGIARAARAFKPVSAAYLRRCNDNLFSPAFKDYMPRYLTDGPVAGGMGWGSAVHRIRQAMIESGRHIDVSNFNEAQSKIGLKRILGFMGLQILESDRLSMGSPLTSVEDLLDLLSYNVSDVVGLAGVFEDKVYSSGFDLKLGLLQEFPETVYDKGPSGAVDVRPDNVRRQRLTIDSTSAKFVGRILAPYDALTDYEVVDFTYPHPEVAKELGVEPFDALDSCKDFFFENIEDEEARERFMLVYHYYDSIRGKNFNDSEKYAKDFATTVFDDDGRPRTGLEHPPVDSLASIPKLPNNLPYYRADGTPSTCFATFSTGGIHGAEANFGALALASQERLQWERRMELVRSVCPDPLDVRLAKVVRVLDPETGEELEVPYSEVLTSKSTIKALKERKEALDALGPDPDPEAVASVLAEDRFKGIGFKPGPKRPHLFKAMAKGNDKLMDSFVYTSVGPVIHEDFSSYYPNLLRNMRAFYNPSLGEDRYAKILADKDRYGKLMKDPSLSQAERDRYSVLRDGTKLILNSASGAGDTTFGRSPIRVNNAIISMRLIGQLLTWRIGQAQTLAGAKIVSTNTDGLYSVLDEETNNRVLAEQQALIHVAIEPEPLVIVSKDSNNRLEMEAEEDGSLRIIGASGGTLACRKAPDPRKSLAHPAVMDHVLAEYLRLIAQGFVPPGREAPLSVDEPMDHAVVTQLLEGVRRQEDSVLALRLFQNVIAASIGMVTFPFALDPYDASVHDGMPDAEVVASCNPRALQHYNRIVYVHPGKAGAVSLRAAGAWMVNPASKVKRKQEGLPAVVLEKAAVDILVANGFATNALERAEGLMPVPEGQDLTVRRISAIDPRWSAMVLNEDLESLGEEKRREILGCLDLGVYRQLVVGTYEKNWMNPVPQAEPFRISFAPVKEPAHG